MKPPRSMNYRYRWLVVFVAVCTLVGCRETGDEPSPPTKQTTPSEIVKPTVDKPNEPAITPDSSDQETKPAQDSPSTKSWTDKTTVPEVFLEPSETTDDKKPDTPALPSEPSKDSQPADPPSEPESEPIQKRIEELESEIEATQKDIEELEKKVGPLRPDEDSSDAAKPDMTPLGEDVTKLFKLQPNSSVWIDKDKHRVILVGQVCQREAPLEMFACPTRTKEHEAVVAVPCQSRIVHAALLAVGAQKGKPVQFYPEYVPASGTRVDIDVRWKDDDGQVRSARAQEWIRDTNTKKPMEHSWVFGGSEFWTDKRTGRKFYSADSGDLICVSNFPSATLDLPIESSQKQGHLLYEAFTENIPPLGTPVTLILKPQLEKKGDKTKEKEKTRKPVAFPALTPEE